MNTQNTTSKPPAPLTYAGIEAHYMDFQGMIALGDPGLFEEDESDALTSEAQALADQLEVPVLDGKVPLFVWRIALGLF